MILRNFLNFIIKFLENFNQQFRKIYLNSNFYDKKISKIYNEEFVYKPQQKADDDRAHHRRGERPPACWDPPPAWGQQPLPL